MTEIYFADPPLKEVSFSFQFEPMSELHLGHLGLLWNEYKDRYPTVQQGDEIPTSIEKFGVIQRDMSKIKFLEGTPSPRLLFISKDGQYVTQFQKDKFIFNWRQEDTEDYPRYSNIKENLLVELKLFLSYLKKNDIPEPDFNQIELTYVNHIDAETNAVQDVFKDIINESRYSSPLELEAFTIQLKHLIKNEGENIGRLYTHINKGNLLSDNSSIYILKFIARSHPLGTSIDGITKAMDLLRLTINDSFSAITTNSMHQSWNKE